MPSQHVEVFTPNVIEPSFGIDRILTGVYEHTFYVRKGAAADAKDAKDAKPGVLVRDPRPHPTAASANFGEFYSGVPGGARAVQVCGAPARRSGRVAVRVDPCVSA